ncbi:hypothetical protein [Prochlorothrix hollandica]|uniref:hypothetical protein n=1 Tax=Prochlorothrix hollandica TaxID=1223 RepID=UPI003342AB95
MEATLGFDVCRFKETQFMYSTSNDAHIVIHYVGGEVEMFNLYAGAEEDGGSALEALRAQIQNLLGQPWLILQLAEETVCINTANITRFEIKPVLFPLEVAGLLGSGERVTALNSRGR